MLSEEPFGSVKHSPRRLPATFSWAARYWHLALVLIGAGLLASSTWHAPLLAQERVPSAQSDQDRPTSHGDEHERILLPTGTEIQVRIADRVDTNKLHSGDLLTGIVDPSLMLNEHVVIPRGTEAHVSLVENKKGGHLHGSAEVQLELTGLVMNGQEFEVMSDIYHKGQGVIAAKVKAAAAPSAGAGVDAASGTNPGSAVSPIVAIFHAAKVDLPPGTRVKFNLTAPLMFEKPEAKATEIGQ